MATPLQYSCLETPRTEEPGGLQSLGSQSWPLLNSHKGSCALAWGWVEGGLDTAERPGHPVQLPGSLVKLASCLEDNLPCDEQAGSILEDTPRMAQSLRGSLNPGSHPDKPGCEAQALLANQLTPGGSPSSSPRTALGLRWTILARLWHPNPLLCKGLPGGFPRLPDPRDTHQRILPERADIGPSPAVAVVQAPRSIGLFQTPWTAAGQDSLSHS